MRKLISKVGVTKYGGSSLSPGTLYHDIPGIEASAHRRSTQHRVDFMLKYHNFKNKRVLDIGCSVGGISTGIAKVAKHVHGVDYDPESIKVARAAAAKLGVTNVTFDVADVNALFLQNLQGYDVVLWLSHWMWFVKQNDFTAGLRAIYNTSKAVPVMFFESAADDGMAAIKGSTQSDILHYLIKASVYQDIRDLGTWDHQWLNRNLFLCKKPKMVWSDRFTGVVQRTAIDRVVKTYRESQHHLVEREAAFLTELHQYRYFPKIFKFEGNELTLSYEGIPSTFLRQDECDHILRILKSHKIQHRDIVPSNFVFNGYHNVLLDFAWSIHDGEDFEAHPAVGEQFKAPDGFDDTYSINKVRQHFGEHRPVLLTRRRKKKDGIIRIISLPVDKGGCGNYRIRQPFKKIKHHTKHDVHIVDKDKDDMVNVVKGIGIADVVVMRPGAELGMRKMRGVPEFKHIKWIMDIDDNVTLISPYSQHYEEYGIEEFHDKNSGLWLWKNGERGFNTERNKQRVSSLISALGEVDLVTVTTKKLAEYASKFNDNVAVLPNCIDFEHWKRLPLRKTKQLRIGWTGGVSHYEDFYSIKEPLNRLMDKYDFTLVTLGSNFSGILKKKHQRRVEAEAWVPFLAHPYRTAAANLDIAIIPLEDTEFNHYKSPIKWFEMSAIGIPSVVANITPYKEVIKDQKTAMAYDSPDDFFKKVEWLIVDRPARTRIGRAAAKWTKNNRDATKCSSMWIDAYRKVL